MRRKNSVKWVSKKAYFMNAHVGCLFGLNTHTSSCALTTGEQSHSFQFGTVIVQNKRSRKLQNQI